MYGRRPLTKLEAAIFAAVVGVFLVVFARQMFGYMEIAERAAMQATLINTTAAINVRLAASYRDQAAGASDWTRRNPFELAGAFPPGFARDAIPGLLEAGQWTYDAERAELLYSPRRRSTLIIGEGERTLRFRLVRGPSGYLLEPQVWFAWE
jgi:hypothetical protein